MTTRCVLILVPFQKWSYEMQQRRTDGRTEPVPRAQLSSSSSSLVFNGHQKWNIQFATDFCTETTSCCCYPENGCPCPYMHAAAENQATNKVRYNSTEVKKHAHFSCDRRGSSQSKCISFIIIIIIIVHYPSLVLWWIMAMPRSSFAGRIKQTYGQGRQSGMKSSARIETIYRCSTVTEILQSNNNNKSLQLQSPLICGH